MGQIKKKDYVIRWIPASKLRVVHESAQRPLNARVAQTIADNFDPDAFDPPAVTQPNKRGIYHLIDGNTRAAALVRLNPDSDQMVPCRVTSARTKQEAAALWLKSNHGHKKPSPLESFLVAVTAGEEDEVAVDQIIRDHGYVVRGDPGDGTISAVRSCLRVYRAHGPVALSWALKTLQETWGMDRDAVKGSMVEAYATLFATNQDVINRARLVKTVSLEGTPNLMIGKAQALRDVYKGSLVSNLVRVLVATYNQGLRSSPRLEG